jgi:hypothetical protein
MMASFLSVSPWSFVGYHSGHFGLETWMIVAGLEGDTSAQLTAGR